jgi:hypothetical protein
MIYLKFSICAQTASDERGTAEFMFKGLDEETATRLGLTLLRNDGWRALNVIELVEADSPSVFVRDGRLQSMYEEAEADDVACAINMNSVAEAVSA